MAFKLVGIVGCEESQEVTKAFRERGHEVYSCDLKDCSGGHPEWHLKMDVFEAIALVKPNLGIFHPPCTRLTNSVWWYILKHGLQDEVKEAAFFFNDLLNAGIEYIGIENPIQNKGARQYIRKQDQIIQPHKFNEDASKATCLWLKGLPLLKNTGDYPPRIVDGKPRWSNQTDGGWNRLGPSEKRAEMRSKTYPGIARAMAEQWGNYVCGWAEPSMERRNGNQIELPYNEII